MQKLFRVICKARGPYIGPRGGKYADPAHKIPWREAWKDPPDTGQKVLTSKDSPLRLDKVKGLHGVRLAFLPGKRNDGFSFKHRRNLNEDLHEIKKEGITHIVDLTEHGEPEHRGGVEDYHERVKDAGFHVIHVPIEDRTVPPMEDSLHALRKIREAREAGGKVLIHCMGGLGRTGVIAGMLLATDEPGIEGDEIIQRLRDARGPRAPDTEEQAERLRSFARAGVSKSLAHVAHVDDDFTREQKERLFSFAKKMKRMHIEKAAPIFVGPRGGKWKDPEHTIPYDPGSAERQGRNDLGFAERQAASELEGVAGSRLLSDDQAFHTQAENGLKYMGRSELRNHRNMLRLVAYGLSSLVPGKERREKLQAQHEMSDEEKAVAAGYLSQYALSFGMYGPILKWAASSVLVGAGMAAGTISTAAATAALATPLSVGFGTYVVWKKGILPAIKKIVGRKESVDLDVLEHVAGESQMQGEDRSKLSRLRMFSGKSLAGEGEGSGGGELDAERAHLADVTTRLLRPVFQESARQLAVAFRSGTMTGAEVQEMVQGVHAQMTKEQEKKF